MKKLIQIPVILLMSILLSAIYARAEVGTNEINDAALIQALN